MVASGVFPGRFPRRSFSSAYLYKKIDATPRQRIKTPSRKKQNEKENKTNKDIKNIIIIAASQDNKSVSRIIVSKRGKARVKKKMRRQTIKCPNFALSNPCGSNHTSSRNI